VSPVEVRCWIQESFNVPGDSFRVQRYYPKDFLITFSFYDDMLWVLHDPLPPSASLILVIKRWRRYVTAGQCRGPDVPGYG
jgi:hypothetical protein